MMKKVSKKFLSVILCIATILCMVPVGVFTVWAESLNTLEIKNQAELLEFAKAVQGGDTFSGKTVVLTADIDFGNTNWLEIDKDGSVVTDYRIPGFAGTFDGQNHTIKNFKYLVSQSGNHRAMMFSGTLTGVVKNLKVENVSATIAGGGTRVAAVANTISATSAEQARLDNVHVKNFTVNSDNLTTDQTWFGGLSVYTNGGYLAVNNCSVTDFTLNANGVYMGSAVSSCITPNNDFKNTSVTNFTANIDTVNGVFGGFAGQTQSGGANASFTNCTVTGLDFNIKKVSGDNLGGFMATIGGATQFEKCSVSGTIDLTEDTLTTKSVGGFIGDHGWNGMYGADRQHEFIDCVTDVDITAVNANVGGFIGNSTVATHPERHIPAYFTGCEAKGDVKTTNGAAGGFVGQGDRGLFTDCSASGNVEGNIAGGFWGYIYPKTKAEAMGTTTHSDPNSKSVVIESCSATGTVEGSEYEAGLIGFVKDVFVDGSNAVGYATPLIISGNTPNDYNRFDYSECTGYQKENFEVKSYVAKAEGSYYETFKEAVAAADGVAEGATVTLLKDITLGEKLTISGDVTIEGAYKITRANTYTGTFFEVKAGASLTLDGGLVIDGGNEWVMDLEEYNEDLNSMTQILAENSAKWFTPEEGAPVATAYMITLLGGKSESAPGGTVNLNKVTIQNNYSVSSGVVLANAAYTTVNLTGAKITHVASTQGSGVVVNASGAGIKVMMNNGTIIDGNHVGGNHGIFKVYSGTVFTMNGGEVTNTTGWNSNGTVAGIYGNGSTFTLNDGLICSNSGVWGPSNGRNAAIYLHASSTFEMNGGTICHNSGRGRGGIDSSKTSSSLTITGGEVLDNISVAGNTTPDVGGTVGTWEITGGTFTQDVSEWVKPAENSAIVIFDHGDGNRVLASVKLGDCIEKPKELPSMNGYSASGWYYNGELFDFNTKITEDFFPKSEPAEGEEESQKEPERIIVIEAKYTVDVTIDYGNGEVETKKVVKGTVLEAPAAPLREGYMFDGWYADGKKFDFSTKITEDVEPEARYVEDKNNNGIEDTVDPAYTDSADDVFARLLNIIGMLARIILMVIFMPFLLV